MDHAEALELIEQSALEPGGLERLASGDTSASTALAGHLVDCPSCTAEYAAARRTAAALRLVAEETPAADLRERTLALVGAVGRPRAEEAADDPGAAGATAPGSVVAGPGERVLRSLRRRLGVVAIAAAAAFALLAAGAFVAADLQRQLDAAHREVAGLRSLGADVQAMLQQPTARLIALHREDGARAGSLIVDPASGRLAVVTETLRPPPGGMEYRCWVEVDGVRGAVGRMWSLEGFAYWSGSADVGAWPPGARFGVSLEREGEPASGPALLAGEL